MGNNKKSGNTIIKDAMVLFIITLISGLLLGFVNDITKGPIEKQKMSGKIAAYKAAYADATNFRYNDNITLILKDSARILNESGKDFGNVTIDEVVEAKDDTGNVIGYVVSSTSKDGYNGNISVSVGISLDGMVIGIEMLELNETAGLGSRAGDAGFKDQYKDKLVDSFILTKNGKTADNEIDALSGATITSTAVTNAVNAALYFVNNSIK